MARVEQRADDRRDRRAGGLGPRGDVAARAQAACATVASVVGALLYAGHAPIVFAACALACAMASSPLMRLTA